MKRKLYTHINKNPPKEKWPGWKKSVTRRSSRLWLYAVGREIYRRWQVNVSSPCVCVCTVYVCIICMYICFSVCLCLTGSMLRIRTGFSNRHYISLCIIEPWYLSPCFPRVAVVIAHKDPQLGAWTHNNPNQGHVAHQRPRSRDCTHTT